MGGILSYQVRDFAGCDKKKMLEDIIPRYGVVLEEAACSFQLPS